MDLLGHISDRIIQILKARFVFLFEFLGYLFEVRDEIGIGPKKIAEDELFFFFHGFIAGVDG